MQRNSLFWAFLAILSLGLFSCKHEIPAAQLPVKLQPCSADSVYFVNEIFPLLISSCTQSGCHEADPATAGSDPITNYAQILDLVEPGDAAHSTLYKRIVATNSTRMPQRPLRVLSTAQIQKIEKWINQGAKKNDCYSCRDNYFTYAADIKPLIDNKCYGCHNDISANGGYDLSTYSNVKDIALSNKLSGSVSWLTGFKAMPKGAGKMPDCEITQIKKWVAAGAPNN